MQKVHVTRNDFFDTQEPKSKQSTENAANEPLTSNMDFSGSHSINPIIAPLIEETEQYFKERKYKHLFDETEKIKKTLNDSKFRISVVGEFSRGKSTFLNSFFGRELLPVGNLPTTAMLTKIVHNDKEMIVHIEPSGKKTAYKLTPSSWDDLIVSIDGESPKGVVFMGINSEFLKENNIEIIDTPGAGDLDPQRAKQINDALLCGDGAIITISALNALSVSEKVFIQEKFITQKTPHLLLIITRLDQVPEEEREKVVKYICDRLKLMELDIPVYIPRDDMNITNECCICGMDSIKSEITSWVRDENQARLKNQSVSVSLMNLLDIAYSELNEKVKLASADEKKKDDII